MVQIGNKKFGGVGRIVTQWTWGGVIVPLVIKTCSHSWRCGHMPLLEMDIGSTISLERGPVLGFKPSGAVLLAGTHGRNVRLFKPEQWA